jgi:hypothetical protein
VEQLLQQHLVRVQQRQKHQAYERHSERQFEVGQMVFVKLQPYIQTNLARRLNQKLSFCYFGHFKILQRIGLVAYKLELPETSEMHHVFHVSAEVPDISNPFQHPVKILQCRRHHHNAQVIDKC